MFQILTLPAAMAKKRTTNKQTRDKKGEAKAEQRVPGTQGTKKEMDVRNEPELVSYNT